MNWGWHLVASLGRGLWPSIRTRRSLAAWSLSTQTLSIPPIRARAEVRRAQSHDPGRRSDSGLQTKGPGGKAHVQRARGLGFWGAYARLSRSQLHHPQLPRDLSPVFGETGQE